MKVAFEGMDLPEGKVKYNDPIVTALVDKFAPAKISPYYFEFLCAGFEAAEAIVVPAAKALDVLILDMERLHGRMERSASDEERALLEKCLAHLETESPLCDMPATEAERQAIRALGPLSMKPTALLDTVDPSTDAVCEAVLQKAGRMFFYTAGKEEVHAWLVDRGAQAVVCAGKIHSDLARGFIRAEIISFEDLMRTHSFQSARAEGLTRLVERDYPIEEKTVLEIRFSA